MSQTQIDSLVVTLDLDSGDFTSKIKGIDSLIKGLTKSLDGLETSLTNTFAVMNQVANASAAANLGVSGIKQGVVNAASGFDELSTKMSLAIGDLRTFSDTANAVGQQKIKLGLGTWKADYSGILNASTSVPSALDTSQNNVQALGGGRVETLLAQIAKYTMFTAMEVKYGNDMSKQAATKVNEAVEENSKKNSNTSRGEIAGFMGYGKLLSSLLNKGDEQIRGGAELAVNSGIQDIPANTLSAWSQISDQANLTKGADVSGLFGNVRNSIFQAMAHKQFTPFMHLLQREMINPIGANGKWRDPEDLLLTLSEDLQKKYDRNTGYNFALEGLGDSNYANLLTSVPNLRGRVGGAKQSTAYSNGDADTMLQIEQSKSQLNKTIDSLIREVTGGFSAELGFFTTLNTMFGYFNKAFGNGTGNGLKTIAKDAASKGEGVWDDVKKASTNPDYNGGIIGGINKVGEWFDGLFGDSTSPTVNVPKAIGGKHSNTLVPGISPDGVSSNPPPLYTPDATRAIVVSNGQGYNRMDLPENKGNTQQININNVNINTPSTNPSDHAAAFKGSMEGYSSISAVATGTQ